MADTQFNIRLDQETINAFRAYCNENGFTQAAGFENLIRAMELDRTKAALPGRVTEIESFQKLTDDLLRAYTTSLEINANAESRIREQFITDLDRKDKTIDDQRKRIEQLQAEKNSAEIAAAEAAKAKEQAEKDVSAAEKVRVAAEKTAEDKQTIADTLAAKLAEAEKKAEGYDDLKTAFSSSEEARKTAEQQIKDIQRDAAEAAKDAAREAEKAREQAVREASDALQTQIDALRDELRTSKSETDTARRDAETARTAAIAELSEVHRSELAEIRAKLDVRTDDLMQTRKENSDMQVLLQKEQAKVADLERQLKDALARIEEITRK